MRATSLWRYLFVNLMRCLLTAGMLRAQAPGTGAITGKVLDPSGLAMANARVSIANESMATSRLAVTNGAGAFTVSLLTPGSYSVAVSAPGFEPSVLHTVRVVVSEISSLEFRLVIEQANASVQVTANVEIAQTQSSTLGRAVDNEAMQALPLENRNYTQILSLSPGVVVALPNAAVLGRGSQDVTANGNKTTANNIQFNGIDANNLAQNSVENDGEEVGAAVPSPDTIQEFKVQTGNYDATYGRGTGANVDMVSKTGTNQFHSSVWEFLRNDAANANNFFLKLDGQPRPVLKQNLFGAAVGGPIWRDRTFFFGAYQGLRSSNGVGGITSVLLPQLTSDRSAATLGAQFCPSNPNDPNDPYLTHAGGTQVACDGSNINPVALALLNYKFPSGQFAIPSPQINFPADPTQPSQFPIGQSTYSIPAKYNEDQFTVNLDQIISNKNQASARFFYSHAPTTEAFSPNAALVPGWSTNELDKNAMLVLADTNVFSSNLINIFRFGYMRFDGVSSVTNPILASDVGTQAPTGVSNNVSIPGITVDGLFTIGDAGTPSQSQTTNSFIWQDTVSWTRGRHNMRMGAEVKRHQVEVNAPFSKDGLLDIRTFDDFLVGQSAAQNGSPEGISNVTSSTGSSGFFRKDERYNDFASFIQDDIQLSQRLTLNAGLRYEIFGAPSEIHGRLLTFDPMIASTDAPPGGTFSGFIVPSNFSGVVPSGVVRSSHAGLWSTPYHDLSPRLGFALRLTDRPMIVLRGGYGIYFDRLSGGVIEGTVGQPPFSLQQSFFDAQNGAATLQQPFNPLLPLNSSYPLFQSRVAGNSLLVSATSPRIIDPYTQEYNLNLQAALGRDYLLEVGYVGTRSLHVAGSLEFNQAMLASPSNPLNGETTNTVENVTQRLPFAGLSPASLITVTQFNSNYNSLQTSVTKHSSHGLQFLASYTWSKNLDQTSGSSGSEVFELWLLTNDQTKPYQAYGLTDFDRTHRGVLSLIYSTPSLSSMPRLARYALAGWQMSGILVAQSGTPLTIIDNNAGLVYGTYSFEHRAQSSGINPYTSGSVFSRVNGHYLNAAAFTDAPMAPNGQSATDTDFGNSGVGIVRGPGQRNIDLAVERTLSIAEHGKLRLRAEFFNLTNTPNFANPNNIVNTGSAFGTIISTSNNPRILQVALKYSF